MGVTKLRLYGQFPIDRIVQIYTPSRRVDLRGRPERRGRRSLRFSFRSTPPQPVGAIQESPAAVTRRDFRGLWHRGNGTGAVPYSAKNPPPRGGGFLIKLFFPIRRAETSDQSGGFTRWIQAQPIRHEFARRGIPAKNPPVPKNQGIFIIICSSQYAERELATSREGPMA